MKHFGYRIFLSFSCLLAGCVHKFSSSDKCAVHPAEVQDLRVHLADVEHMLHGQQVSLDLMDERLRKSSSYVRTDPKLGEITQLIAALERRLVAIESTQQKIAQDMIRLSVHANQTAEGLAGQQAKFTAIETELAWHSKRLEDIQQLKGTLKAISQAVGTPSVPKNRTYTVKPGDTLDKIAKDQGTTVDALKKANHLEGDRIRVGAQLQLP